MNCNVMGISCSSWVSLNCLVIELRTQLLNVTWRCRRRALTVHSVVISSFNGLKVLFSTSYCIFFNCSLYLYVQLMCIVDHILGFLFRSLSAEEFHSTVYSTCPTRVTMNIWNLDSLPKCPAHHFRPAAVMFLWEFSFSQLLIWAVWCPLCHRKELFKDWTITQWVLNCSELWCSVEMRALAGSWALTDNTTMIHCSFCRITFEELDSYLR